MYTNMYEDVIQWNINNFIKSGYVKRMRKVQKRSVQEIVVITNFSHIKQSIIFLI